MASILDRRKSRLRQRIEIKHGDCEEPTENDMVRPALHTTLFFEEEADDGKAADTEEEDAIDELVLNDQVVAAKRQDGRVTLMFRADSNNMLEPGCMTEIPSLDKSSHTPWVHDISKQT